MNKRFSILFVLLSGFMWIGGSFAHTSGDVEINDAWVREAPPNAEVLGAYMTIANHTAKEIALVGVRSPAFDEVEMHRSMEKDGMMSMIKQDLIAIPADGTVKLQPGGYHLMLMKPKQALKAGDNVSLTFTFSDGKRSVISAPVKKANAVMDTKMNMNHDHHHDDAVMQQDMHMQHNPDHAHQGDHHDMH